MLNLMKSSRFAVVCAVVLVAVAGFGLMTSRDLAENNAVENYDGPYEDSNAGIHLTMDADDYALSETPISYAQESIPELLIESDECSEDDYIIVFPGVNFNPDFGPPSRFNRDDPQILTWSWPVPERSDVPAHLRSFFALSPSTVEGETVRLLVNYMNDSPMPEGWYLTHIDLGGREQHLFFEFETHAIMLNPYTIALEYVVIDAPWTHGAELALMEQADLLFEHFEELLAVSFRVQKVERADGMTDYKNAQLTKERSPIHGNNTWCHVDYVTHLIPFYVNVGTPDDIRVTFQWMPAGFELYEVENIVNSLQFEELGLQMESLRIPDTWLQYGPHVYSFAIDFAQTKGLENGADIGEELAAQLNDIAKYLFDSFGDLLRVHYFFRLSDYGILGFPVWR